MLLRRDLLAFALGAGLAPAVALAAPGRFFGKDRPLGIQLYTLGPDLAQNFEPTLQQVAKIGYRTVELAGFLGHTPQVWKDTLDRCGLVCPSAHVSAQSRGSDPGLDGDLGALADSLHVIGVETVVMPIVSFPARFQTPPKPGENMLDMLRRVGEAMTADDWKANADFLNQKAAALRKLGLGMAYHNHNLEFRSVGGTDGMQILLAHTDPALVHFEMDVGWVCAAGADPFALLKANPGRFRMMHVKDIKASTKPNYALQQDPTEVGKGIIPWPRLLPVAVASGVRRFFVEEEPPYSMPRLEAVKESFDYLATL